MRILFFALVAISFVSCGKLSNKFGRLEDQFTRVSIAGPRDLNAALNGGMMIYFARTGAGQGGKAFGFTSAELSHGADVVVPNGEYRVYAMGTEGANSLEGQAKCGYGNGGELLQLSGGRATVAITLNTANCAFGTTTPFGDSVSANASNNDFDQLTFAFCGTQAYPSCDTISASNYRVRLRMVGGEKPAQGSFATSEAFTLTSGCSATMTSGTITTSFKALAGSTLFSPPFEILVYSDVNCANGAVGRLLFPDGFHHLRSVASGSAAYLDSPATNNTSYLKFKFP